MQMNLELATMADDLSERYEELNLIFRSDDHVLEINKGREMLNRLVDSCIMFLDVAAVSLLLPGKDIEIMKINPGQEFIYPATLISFIKRELIPAIFDQRNPIVINSLSDFQSAGAYPDIFKAYRVLSVPVETGEHECAGVLSVVIPTQKRDFTNSDRNLLGNVAKKVASVILTSFDKLTGLANRALLESEIERLLQTSKELAIDHAIIDCDVDKLQIVNDICGNSAGDDLLRLIGKTIRKEVGEGGLVSRVGSDEFCILLEQTTLSQAFELARVIRSRVNSLIFEREGYTFEVNLSIGVAPITGECESASTLLSSVEVACNAAKDKGRNQIQMYVPDDSELLRRRGEMHWVSRIQKALHEDRFILYAQPICPTDGSDEHKHYEILLRLRDEEGQILSPGAFIPAAEHFNLMPAIDRWVIRNTFQLLARVWQKLPKQQHTFSLNLSGQSLTDEGFDDFLVQQIEQSTIPNDWLCFEITESAAISNLKQAKALIAKVKRLGCQISLDDFGSGLSSYSYLRDFDVDCLKIDGAFIRNIVTDNVTRTMVSAMNQIGHAMGLSTVGEWVENPEIFEQLRLIGVDFAQGYELGRPQQLIDILDCTK
ncbi:MAG: GGDEF domain-containing protein [Sedimenticola sp.]|nr:MAG: GGDEF domain-containing protein [Sedimenticola sp.]